MDTRNLELAIHRLIEIVFWSLAHTVYDVHGIMGFNGHMIPGLSNTLNPKGVEQKWFETKMLLLDPFSGGASGMFRLFFRRRNGAHGHQWFAPETAFRNQAPAGRHGFKNPETSRKTHRRHSSGQQPGQCSHERHCHGPGHLPLGGKGHRLRDRHSDRCHSHLR